MSHTGRVWALLSPPLAEGTTYFAWSPTMEKGVAISRDGNTSTTQDLLDWTPPVQIPGPVPIGQGSNYQVRWSAHLHAFILIHENGLNWYSVDGVTWLSGARLTPLGALGWGLGNDDPTGIVAARGNGLATGGWHTARSTSLGVWTSVGTMAGAQPFAPNIYYSALLEGYLLSGNYNALGVRASANMQAWAQVAPPEADFSWTRNFVDLPWLGRTAGAGYLVVAADALEDWESLGVVDPNGGFLAAAADPASQEALFVGSMGSAVITSDLETFVPIDSWDPDAYFLRLEFIASLDRFVATTNVRELLVLGEPERPPAGCFWTDLVGVSQVCSAPGPAPDPDPPAETTFYNSNGDGGSNGMFVIDYRYDGEDPGYELICDAELRDAITAIAESAEPYLEITGIAPADGLWQGDLMCGLSVAGVVWEDVSYYAEGGHWMHQNALVWGNEGLDNGMAYYVRIEVPGLGAYYGALWMGSGV